MATTRTTNTWLFIHRWFGLVTAVFLLLAAVTGSVLTVRDSLDRWANGDLYQFAGDAGARLSAVEAVARFEDGHPDLQVVGFPLNGAANENIAVNVTAKPGADTPGYDQVFIDPTDGTPIGERKTSPGFSHRQIVPLIAEFHYNLLAGDAGRIFMGFIALGWLLSALIGFYLTFPKRGPFFSKWWSAWTYSPKRTFARQMLDIHRASGLWLFVFLLVVAFTSVALNFFFEVWSPLSTWVAPLEKSLFDQPIPFPDGAVPDLAFAEALSRAQEQAASAGIEWQPATMLYYQSWDLYGVTFTDNGILNYKALGPIYYYFDAASGAYAHEVNPYTDSAGLVMIRMLYPLHTGEIGGFITVVFVFLTGIATAEMCVTGVWVWWKKRGPRIAAKRRKAELDASQT